MNTSKKLLMDTPSCPELPMFCVRAEPLDARVGLSRSITEIPFAVAVASSPVIATSGAPSPSRSPVATRK